MRGIKGLVAVVALAAIVGGGTAAHAASVTFKSFSATTGPGSETEWLAAQGFSSALVAEGRIGIVGPGDWELGLGVPDTSSPLERQAEFLWQNGVAKEFSFLYQPYNGVTPNASFTVGGTTLRLAADLAGQNALVIRASASQEPGKVRAATLRGVALNGVLVDDGSAPGVLTAPDGGNRTALWLISGVDFSTPVAITGNAFFEWDQDQPTRSRLAFQFKAGAVPVPEPGTLSMLGLAMATAAGAVRRRP